MRVELYCPSCCSRFVAPPETAATEVLDRMEETGPFFSLGDGETFEDMIFATLTENGAIHCPECGQAVAVSEESLGQVALELLSRW